MENPPIQRTTLFKVPDVENQKKLLEAYRVMMRDQVKDGKPYILFSHVGQAKEDQRSKGYTIVAQHWFASIEDQEYYDDECPAHAALKKEAAGLGIPEPPVVIHVERVPTLPN